MPLIRKIDVPIRICHADNAAYTHNRRADKNPYQHNSRAGKQHYRQDHHVQAQCKSGLRYTTSFEVVNLVLGLKMCM